ncbi:GNAT family N-acetyltransferase [Fusibacter sp. JL216-2]|uniref:GNAT family N-acetyltransferase n=1 Tax=Fusibacter sp. JL216-2 TaxID=3071453 RepID=UPI003D32EC7A
MKIRRSNRSDTPELSRLYYQLSEDHFYKEKFTDDAPDFNKAIDVYAEKIHSKDIVIYVAEEDNKVCGYIEMHLKKSDGDFFLDDYSYILHAYVDSDKRGYKVIRRLFKACEDYTKECGLKFMLLDVYSHNERVQKLAQHFGMGEYRTRYLKNLEVC